MREMADTPDRKHGEHDRAAKNVEAEVDCDVGNQGYLGDDDNQCDDKHVKHRPLAEEFDPSQCLSKTAVRCVQPAPYQKCQDKLKNGKNDGEYDDNSHQQVVTAFNHP